MSIINKLKSASAQKAAQLLKTHPLSSVPEEVRLRYLAAIAMGVAVDREPSIAEKQSFFALAKSLDIEEADAVEQLDERASVNEETIHNVFSALRQQELGTLYLLDLAWQHVADGVIDPQEVEATEALAEMLALRSPSVSVFHQFALSLKQRNCATLVSVLPDLASDAKLQTCLAEILKPCFPYVRVIYERWIEHGDGTFTDSATGKMWAGFLLGQYWENGEVKGTRFGGVKPQQYGDLEGPLKIEEFYAELHAFNSANRVQNNFSWKIATYDDFLSLARECDALTALETVLRKYKGVLCNYSTSNNGVSRPYILGMDKLNLTTEDEYWVNFSAYLCRDWPGSSVSENIEST